MTSRIILTFTTPTRLVIKRSCSSKEVMLVGQHQGGGGILNTLIDKIPFELHLPHYQYCGPATHLEKRLARGDPGINELDRACKEHDIEYAKHKDLVNRHRADLVLQKRAWNRVKSSDASVGERAAALLVSGAMKAKRSLGMGLECKTRRKKSGGTLSFMSFIKQIASRMRRAGSGLGNDDVKSTTLKALKIARMLIKKKKVRVPRVIPVPNKIGGFLPLLPLIFAGLGAAGSLAGGGAAIARAVNDAKNKSKMLDEAMRHNKTIEAIAMGNKKGSGLYLKPYRKGYGLYLKPRRASKN